MAMNKELIIKEIKKHLGITRDGDFAEFLGINQNTLSSWKSRDSINYELIISKCQDIDANWLITGEGSMLKGTETIKEMVPLSSIISWHFARNTYISLLLASGVNPIFVQGNVGHSDLKTTMIYSKQNDVTLWKETLKAQNK